MVNQLDARPSRIVFCDESRPELFYAKTPSNRLSMIGSLWVESDFLDQFKKDFWAIRAKYSVWGEVKWNKISDSRVRFYRALVKYFFSRRELRFRVIVVDSSRLDLERFHNSDAELGFYKFYFQLLTHWVEPEVNYRFFCDAKVNRDHSRLVELQKVLQHANPQANVSNVESTNSAQSAGVQMADVLLGGVQWRLSAGAGTSAAKERVVLDIEQILRHRIGATHKSEPKFNVFKIMPGGITS